MSITTTNKLDTDKLDHINVFAMIVAAGRGSRFGSDIPKQYQKIDGTTILEHSVSALFASQYIQRCCLVIATDDTLATSLDWRMSIDWAIGGEERWQSVQSGLDVITNMGATERDLVLIHDAARPCVLASDIDRVIEIANTEDYGAILATPVADTLKQVNQSSSYIEKTIDRRGLWQAQTPQVFRLGYLKNVLKYVAKEKLMITDEASAFEQFGYPVAVVEGNRSNIKLTYPEDFSLVSAILAMNRV